jgi:tetratricopeptide (TPR) repeat protein
MLWHAVKWFTALLLAAGLISPAATATNATLKFLEQRVAADPLDNVAQARLAFEYVNVMRTSGDLTYLQRAEQAARASLQSVPAARNPDGVSALAVALYESHRFKEALQLAQQAASLDSRNLMTALLIGDAQLALGDYGAAERTYTKLAGGRAGEFVTTRLARLATARGNSEAALGMLAGLLTTAEESLQLHVRLQLAELHFARGAFTQAREHLDAAQRLEPDNYAVQEHLAELHAAEGRFADAVALYRKVITRVPRPELMHALGDLYQLMERPQDARAWLTRAKVGYLQSAEQGNAHYYHHLASFFSDSDPQPGQALRWAREDLKVRDGAPAYDGLAWALYKNGEHQAAAEAMDRALAAGTSSAHLLFHAGTIYTNVGRIAQGRKLLQQALTINPRYNTFHVHR